jgi:hypothetical protein
MALSNPKFDANIVRQILAITGGDKQKLIEMFNDPKQKHLQPAILMADMQSQALKRDAEIKQGQGQGQHPTVAAALGLAPSSAPPTPPAPPAGLGATPQGMQMASAAPQGPVGMAAGGMTELPDSYGLESLPIPDDMYDERTFAGGGIVAFSKGGTYVEQLLAKADEYEAEANSNKHSGLVSDYYRNQASALRARAQRGGSVIPPTAPIIDYTASRAKAMRETPGAQLSSSDQLAQFPGYKYVFMNPEEISASDKRVAAARQVVVGIDKQLAPAPSTTPSPLPGGRPYVMGSETATAPTPAPTPAPTRTPAPLGDRGVVGAPRAPAGAATPEDDYGLPKAPGEFNRQNVFDEILKMQGAAPGMEKMSAEEKAAQKNEDLYSILAQIGFGMAAGESPNFLTNVGKATAAATPAMQEALKERRAETKEERKAELERQRLEYGARGTAAAATRAEETAMRTYGLNLAEAKAKIANDKATLALEIKKANALASYYSKAGRDRDAAMVNRLSSALQRIAKNPNDEEAIAERDAIQQLQGRGLGLNRGKLTPDQALRQATNETKSFDFVLPKDMTVQQYIDARKLELMGSGGGVSNPEIDDIVNQYT